MHPLFLLVWAYTRIFACVVWGSDWPVCDLASSYADWVAVLDEILAGEETVGRVTAADPIEPGVFEGPVAEGPFEAFYREITEGIEAPTSIRRNIRTIAWIDAAVRSLKSGEVVRLQAAET